MKQMPTIHTHSPHRLATISFHDALDASGAGWFRPGVDIKVEAYDRGARSFVPSGNVAHAFAPAFAFTFTIPLEISAPLRRAGNARHSSAGHVDFLVSTSVYFQSIYFPDICLWPRD